MNRAALILALTASVAVHGVLIALVPGPGTDGSLTGAPKPRKPSAFTLHTEPAMNAPARGSTSPQGAPSPAQFAPPTRTTTRRPTTTRRRAVALSLPGSARTAAADGPTPRPKARSAGAPPAASTAAVTKPPPPRPPAPRRSLPDAETVRAAARRYLGRLRTLLQRAKQYPPLARRNRIQGTVRLAFVVQADGRITEVRVTRSSGAALLDQAGRAALGRISGRLRPPKILGGRRIRSSVRLAFELH